MDDLERAEREVTGSSIWALRGGLSSLGRMRYVVYGNARDLQEFAVDANRPERLMHLGDREHPERYEAFLDEADRLLHNYLAASYALGQQLKHFFKTSLREAPAEVTAEFWQRHEEIFSRSPLGGFVRELRRIDTHGVKLVVRGQESWVRGRPTPWAHSLFFEKGLLRRDGTWKGSAKNYLDAAPDDIHVEDVIEQHAASVLRFASEVIDGVGKLYAVEFAELERRTAEILRERRARLAEPSTETSRTTDGLPGE